MPSRKQNGCFRMDFMPTQLYADIYLQPIPYVEKYRHPITEQQSLVQEELCAFDAKIKATATSDYAEDRLQVTHEATTTYPCISIEHGFDYWVPNTIIPAAHIILFALRHLSGIRRIRIQIFGTDYKENKVRLADYEWKPVDGVLHERALSFEGWHQLLLWYDGKLQDWPEKDSNLVLSERFLHHGVIMRYIADYVFCLENVAGKLQATKEIDSPQAKQKLEPYDYAAHVSSTLQTLKDLFAANS